VRVYPWTRSVTHSGPRERVTRNQGWVSQPQLRAISSRIGRSCPEATAAIRGWKGSRADCVQKGLRQDGQDLRPRGHGPAVDSPRDTADPKCERLRAAVAK